MTSTPETPTPFDAMMDMAQEVHGRQLFDAAVNHWNSAIQHAPNESERARALRGMAASTWRANPADFRQALSFAQEAQVVHTELCGPVGVLSKPPEVVRQRIESDRVVGRMLLHSAVGYERAGDRDTAWENYQQAMPSLGSAFTALEDLRTSSRRTDQHEINVLPDISIGMSLSPRNFAPALTATSGLRLALRAVRLAPLSERPSGPTSARLGSKHHMRAIAKSSVRAGAALTISQLATAKGGSSRRAAALQIAAKVL